jgi:hypothetical protein
VLPEQVVSPEGVLVGFSSARAFLLAFRSDQFALLWKDRRGALMIDQEHVESELPELDRMDDPEGGAVAWALLAVGGALVAGILLAVLWAAGTW